MRLVAFRKRLNINKYKRMIQMCGKVELNNVQSSLLFILRFLIQLLGGIVIGMLIGNFQKVIKRGKTQSEKKQ